VLIRNLKEKTWLISVLPNKRPDRFGAEKQAICCKRQYRPEGAVESKALPPGMLSGPRSE
jgi:hypothetical protein